jgi:hypothetical protein
VSTASAPGESVVAEPDVAPRRLKKPRAAWNNGQNNAFFEAVAQVLRDIVCVNAS